VHSACVAAAENVDPLTFREDELRICRIMSRRAWDYLAHVEQRKTQMAILNIIKKMVTELVASSDADYTLDSVAYRVQADDRELRFSPSSALRRYY
jgi:hypothetical protein